MSKFYLKEGEEKKGGYPYLSENIIPGQRILVRSRRHKELLMKRHGLHDGRDYSMQSIRAKKKRYNEERKSKVKDSMLDIYRKAKYGKIDLRQAREKQKKHEYMVRNGYIKP